MTEEVIGYQCLTCGKRVGIHEAGEHREVTGHDDFLIIKKEGGDKYGKKNR